MDKKRYAFQPADFDSSTDTMIMAGMLYSNDESRKAVTPRKGPGHKLTITPPPRKLSPNPNSEHHSGQSKHHSNEVLSHRSYGSRDFSETDDDEASFKQDYAEVIREAREAVPQSPTSPMTPVQDDSKENGGGTWSAGKQWQIPDVSPIGRPLTPPLETVKAVVDLTKSEQSFVEQWMSMAEGGITDSGTWMEKDILPGSSSLPPQIEDEEYGENNPADDDDCDGEGFDKGAIPLYVYSNCLEAWPALVAYDGCMRVCLLAAEQGCMEAHQFLKDGAFLLSHSLGLQKVLLQPGQTSKLVTGGNDKVENPNGQTPPGKAQARRRNLNTVKVQVKRVRMQKGQLTPSGSIRGRPAGPWAGMFKRTGMLDSPPDVYCEVRLSSMAENEAQKMNPAHLETVSLYPENSTDDIVLRILDSKGVLGRAIISLSGVIDEQLDGTRWISFFSEGAVEPFGQVQLSINYSAVTDWATMGGSIPETHAYSTLLEVSLSMQGFQKRQLYMHGPWHWLLKEFASAFSISDSYINLRYMVHIMEVATPTEDCLLLLHDILSPVIKAKLEDTLTRQERRILANMEEQLKSLLAFTFEHYKVLDDKAFSGISDLFILPTGTVSPALVPAVMLFSLLYDVLSADSQAVFKSYFQTSARKRCRHYLADSDELAGSRVPLLGDGQAEAFRRLRKTCLSLSSEIRSDIGIHGQHILPSFLDLPSVTSEVYIVELNSRLFEFLRANPPSGPTLQVTELFHTCEDLQQDLQLWGIRSVPGWIDSRALFAPHVEGWIRDLRGQLLDLCRSEKARWLPDPEADTHGTSPFLEELYGRIFDSLGKFDSIMRRWPEMTLLLEAALSDVERGVLAAMEKVFSEHLAPLKEIMSAPKTFSLHNFGSKLARRRNGQLYQVSFPLGIMLNTIKRLLDTLMPQLESRMRVWVANMPEKQSLSMSMDHGTSIRFGEKLAEVTVELRAKYRNNLQGIVEKLCENTKLVRVTNLKRVLLETKAQTGDDMHKRMQPLGEMISMMLTQQDKVLSCRVFVGVARGLWDRLARQVLDFLDDRKENMSWFKSSSAGIALQVLDNMFTMHLQKMQGHALLEKDLEPPRTVIEARSMLSMDVPSGIAESYSFI